jgi:Protein of unknown function (DUF3551)
VMTAVLIDAGAGGAKAAAWCAWYDAYTYDCGYYTFQQCLDTIHGSGSYCSRNVYDSSPPVAALNPPRRHKRHRHHG